MLNPRFAVYAGTFDPLTKGHLWMIEQGARLFDTLTVSIGVNPEKKCLFSLEERNAMLRETLAHIPNVKIDSFTSQYLIRYAQSRGAGFILRGIRNESDYEYERVMRNLNGDLSPEVTTLFLMPPREIAEISSSLVKGLIGPAGWESLVQQYVPTPVFRRLQALHAQ